ncbi:tyrosine-type recombinase/integrase [Maribacter aurantiacus]|uniref:Site-specific integrase n=1 Tax=Maribacter aurantiacus TaxID=1882343 RepID=A0A5R8MC27_9FLAO|nr:tyrosine-type recombinase/integrase [Maribacter aurantiacus]TLF47121.1 site-specific integrase [Maribacter aurantiacus]
MSNISLLLLKVHENVHVFNMKLNFSEPKIYTGGVNIDDWPRLTKEQRKKAMEKQWYLYYRYRNPETGKLVKQTHIKGGANRYKDKRSRYHILKQLQQALSIVLHEGYNPYDKNNSLIEYLEERLYSKKTDSLKNKKTPEPELIVSNPISIQEAFDEGLRLKQKMMGDDSFKKFKSRINRFCKWLEGQNFNLRDSIDKIDKKIVMQHLNEVLLNTSAANRNNTRADLRALFQTLEDNDIIKDNFIANISKLRSTPTMHKSYSPSLLEKLDDYLKSNDPILRLFIQFISYNFLRPVEVCRLRIEDIDFKAKKLYLKTKNQKVKIKIIPEILFNNLPDLSQIDKSHFLFTPQAIGDIWGAEEGSRRDYFTKRFKKVKDLFKLNEEYTLYSYRHTYVSKLYREFLKSKTPFEAKSALMLITGHKSMKALEAYLREIDAVFPEDYSKHLE